MASQRTASQRKAEQRKVEQSFPLEGGDKQPGTIRIYLEHSNAWQGSAWQRTAKQHSAQQRKVE